MSEPTSETPAEVVTAEIPTTHYTNVQDLLENEPSFVQAVREYYANKRAEYAQRITAIDDLLGFIELEAALGTRLERLERHVGIK